MNVLSLLGSARKKGNTATVLGWIEDGLRSAGHGVERVHLATKTINGCLGCGKCKSIPDRPGCVQKDDGLEILEQMTRIDAVILASPLYYWGFSSHIKALIDRNYCLYRGDCGGPGHFSFVEGKRQALVVTAADSFEDNAEFVVSSFQRMLGYNKTESAGKFVVCNCTTPNDLGKEIREKAGEFAIRMFDRRPAPFAMMLP